MLELMVECIFSLSFFVLFFGQVQRRWSRAESGQPLGEVQRRGEERRGEKEGRQTVYQEFPPASAGSLPHQLAVHASPLPPRVPAAIPQRLPPPRDRTGGSFPPGELPLAQDFLFDEEQLDFDHSGLTDRWEEPAACIN